MLMNDDRELRKLFSLSDNNQENDDGDDNRGMDPQHKKRHSILKP